MMQVFIRSLLIYEGHVHPQPLLVPTGRVWGAEWTENPWLAKIYNIKQTMFGLTFLHDVFTCLRTRADPTWNSDSYSFTMSR
jgi:hypothetical protein